LSKKIEVFSIDGGKFFAQRAAFPDKIWMKPYITGTNEEDFGHSETMFCQSETTHESITC
jgi:hypothetical protein